MGEAKTRRDFILNVRAGIVIIVVMNLRGAKGDLFDVATKYRAQKRGSV